MTIAEEHITPAKAAKKRSDYLLFLRHFFAYQHAAGLLGLSEKILEIGSGDGYGSAHLAAEERLVIASDMDVIAARTARQAYSVPNLHFLSSDALSLPFSNTTFDAVIAFQVIEHIKEDVEFLREVKRVLKAGGRFILTTPNRDFRLKPGQKPFNPHHVREYTNQELHKTLRSVFAGVEVLDIFATPEVEAIEKARVVLNRRLTALDPLNLRRYVPVSIKNALVNPIRTLLAQNRTEAGDLSSKYDQSVFSCGSNDQNHAIDFFAVCES